jgi:hypothetical protein
MNAMPSTHYQPMEFIEGKKGYWADSLQNVYGIPNAHISGGVSCKSRLCFLVWMGWNVKFSYRNKIHRRGVEK